MLKVRASFMAILISMKKPEDKCISSSHKNIL